MSDVSRANQGTFTEFSQLQLGQLTRTCKSGFFGPSKRVLIVTFSVVKSRLQAGHAKYKSALDGILSIIKNEGIGGIYKGVGKKLLQSVLTAAILFVGQKKIHEVIKKVSIPFHKTQRYL